MPMLQQIRHWIPFRQFTIQEQLEGARRLERDFERMKRFRSEHSLQYWIFMTGLVATVYLLFFFLDYLFPLDPNMYQAPPFPWK